MTDQQLLERIAVNPKVMGGRPVIKGTRLTVEHVRQRIAQGETVADLLREHEGLVADDIVACLLYPGAEAEGPGRGAFDLGHRGDVDYTQIIAFLKLTPEERLERHEGWRLFMKEALHHAAVRQGHDREAGPGSD